MTGFEATKDDWQCDPDVELVTVRWPSPDGPPDGHTQAEQVVARRGDATGRTPAELGVLFAEGDTLFVVFVEALRGVPLAPGCVLIDAAGQWWQVRSATLVVFGTRYVAPCFPSPMRTEDLTSETDAQWP